MSRVSKNCAFGLSLILVLLWGAPAVAAGQVTPFTARYDFSHNSFLLAKMERTLRKEGETYVFESKSETAGILSAFLDDRIRESSEWILFDGKPRPLSYQYHHTGREDERHVELDFDWGKGVVTNTVNKDPWQMEVPEGTQDKLLYQYTLMRDLQDGKKDLEYEVADGGHLKTYEFRHLGEENMETPLGELTAVKLQRTHGSRRTVIWCAAALDYLPVRIEQHKDGKTLRMVIRGVEGISLNRTGNEKNNK